MDTAALKNQLFERFQKLPPVVQNAITSADVQAHLQSLASAHKLHVDQWEGLENEVMMTLYGIQPAENLVENIQHEVGVDADTAQALGQSVSEIVFEPIRQELERQLEHPDAVKAAQTGAEEMRTKILTEAKQETVAPQATMTAPVAATPQTQSVPAAAPIVPATPPTSAPVQKAARAPFSSTYAPSQPSHERKEIEGDPYREPVA